MNTKDIQKDISCPICQSKDLIVRYENVSGNKTLLACRTCSVWFLHPFPDEEERKEIYKEEYFGFWGYSPEGAESVRVLKKHLYGKILREIEQYAKLYRILDIGCAMGYSLEAAKEKGIKPYGVEISEFAGKIAQERFGDDVKIGDIRDVDFKDTSFDAVTMIDLLEHVEEPVSILKKVNDVLKKNGTLAILVPDLSSCSSKILGRNWTHVTKVAQHLFLFSPKSIKLILASTGFRTEAIKPFRKPMTPLYAKNVLSCGNFRFLYYVANMICAVLPEKLKTTSFDLPTGEMLVIAKKIKNA